MQGERALNSQPLIKAMLMQYVIQTLYDRYTLNTQDVNVIGKFN